MACIPKEKTDEEKLLEITQDQKKQIEEESEYGSEYDEEDDV